MNRAQALLGAVGKMYAEMKTYQDGGVVTFRDGSGESRIRTSFSTRFSRPSQFQFLFESPHPYLPFEQSVIRHACGMDETSAYFWAPDYGGGNARLEAMESVELAIASATGISSGSAFTIGQLLFQGATEWYRPMIDLVMRDDEPVDGIRCHVLSGRLEHAPQVMKFFYLEKEALLLRRVIFSRPNFRSEETRRDIRVNEPIPSEQFARPGVD